jgi:hypothetical protein
MEKATFSVSTSPVGMIRILKLRSTAECYEEHIRTNKRYSVLLRTRENDSSGLDSNQAMQSDPTPFSIHRPHAPLK